MFLKDGNRKIVKKLQYSLPLPGRKPQLHQTQFGIYRRKEGKSIIALENKTQIVNPVWTNANLQTAAFHVLVVIPQIMRVFN